MLLQPITVPFSKSTLKPSVYTLSYSFKIAIMQNFKGGMYTFPKMGDRNCHLRW